MKEVQIEEPQILGATVQNVVGYGNLAPRICASLIIYQVTLKVAGVLNIVT
jgi:hypothetical protein